MDIGFSSGENQCSKCSLYRLEGCICFHALNTERRLMSDRAERVSYFFICGVLALAGWMHLATPLFSALFAYLALSKLLVFKRGGKWLAVLLFVILLCGASYALGHFIKRTAKAAPEIAEKAIPSIIDYAKKYEIELPFDDYDSLKDLGIETAKRQSQHLAGFARFARAASTQVIFFVIGVVVAMGLFLNPKFDLTRAQDPPSQSLYSLCGDQIAARFRTFYASFVKVMGAQILISAINTFFTTVFVLVVHLPYALVVVGVTFLCGLLPVLGNLISNTVIVCIGFTVSPQMAIAALVFLVVIHKLEYFLNSKIVGHRIQNPVWLTLLGLIVGERLLGLPGLFLAPVILDYIKTEASAIKVRKSPDPPEEDRTHGPNFNSSTPA
jgi:predicted PurR-regulated permease PerM